MIGQLLFPRKFPLGRIIKIPCKLVAAVPVVLAVALLSMLLAILSVRQSWAARITARAFWLSRHRVFLLIDGKKERVVLPLLLSASAARRFLPLSAVALIITLRRREFLFFLRLYAPNNRLFFKVFTKTGFHHRQCPVDFAPDCRV